MKKTIIAMAAAILVVPAAGVVAADQFSVSTAKAAYTTDISYSDW